MLFFGASGQIVYERQGDHMGAWRAPGHHMRYPSGVRMGIGTIGYDIATSMTWRLLSACHVCDIACHACHVCDIPCHVRAPGTLTFGYLGIHTQFVHLLRRKA